jgi:sodium-dependent dicarboxylate transporter 2/3/5
MHISPDFTPSEAGQAAGDWVSSHRRMLWAAAMVALPPVIFVLSGSPQPLVLGLITSIALIWFCEALPLPVGALLVPTLSVLYGIQDAENAFRPFGAPIIFLLVGSLLLAAGFKASGLDRRIAYFLVLRLGGSTSPRRLVFSLTLLTWFVSMWMSNTATCSVMLPICLGVAYAVEDSLPKKAWENFLQRLLLMSAFTPAIGGLATPVGSLPNSLAFYYLGTMGLQPTFLSWMLMCLPVSVTLLAFSMVLLNVLHPLPAAYATKVEARFESAARELGPLSVKEIEVGLVFVLAVVGWLLPGLLAEIAPGMAAGAHLGSRLPPAIVALAASTLLFILPAPGPEGWTTNLTWEEVRSTDWGTIALFGGGLCLGSIIESSGLAAGAFHAIAQGEIIYPAATVLLITILTVLISEFCSNVAAAAVVLPMFAASPMESGFQSAPGLIVLVVLAAGLGFALPASTPPNAMVYGTGKLPYRALRKAGIAIDILGIVTLLSFYWFGLLNLR